MIEVEDTGSQDPVVKRMLRNFKLSAEAENENRVRGLRALKFRAGGKEQWDNRVYDLFGDQNKPRESFNQIPQFIHQITNDMRMNMPQTRIAAGDGGDDEVADVREDLCRAIQSTTEGEVAYDTAVDSQVTIGWGYWRYITRYADKKTKNQDIAVKWIPNPFQVYDDPNALEQDFSDRTFLIQVEDVHVDDFNGEYDKEYDDEMLQTIGDKAPSWSDMGDKTVRIAEYWEAKKHKKTIYFDKDGNPTEKKTDDSREVENCKVTWYKCTGSEVLDTREWEGEYIPYVRVAGETLYIDGKVLYVGIVDSMIPVQTQYNYFMNNATYLSSLAPLAPFIYDPEQIEGYEDVWARANIDPLPGLPARIYKDGKQYPFPQRSTPNVDLSNSLQMLQQGQQNFYNVTGIYPASLGQQGNESSGKAIMARQKEGDVSTYHFQDNLARALRFGGRILNDLIPKIYDAARTVALLKEDRTSYKVKINQEHDDDGVKKNIEMDKGEYSVSVTTGPSYSTRKSEAADQAIQIIQSFPAIMQTAAGPELVRSMDLVQADMIADGLERSLPPQFQTPPDMKKLPPEFQNMAMQAQGQIQQLTEQSQQMQQIIQQGTQEIQGLQSQLQNKQADAQAKMMDSQIKGQELQLKAQESQAQREIDMMNAQIERETAQANMQLDRDKLAQDRELRIAELALQARALDIEEIKLGIGQDVAENEFHESVVDKMMDQDHALEMQQAIHGQEQNMAVLNSALTPPPVDNSVNMEQNV